MCDVRRSLGTSIVIVLGAPNADSGELSVIALSRATRALELLDSLENSVLVLTGGFGAFNRSHQPHAEHLRRYINSAGVNVPRILMCPETSNTVEDAIHARRALEAENVDGTLIVVTSDYHKERAELIFKAVFAGREILFEAALAHLPPNELEVLKEHERRALDGIVAQGGVIIPGG